jgi:hypothetical protein
MMSLRRKHRWFGMGFLLAWALSHSAVVSAQNESARAAPTDKIRRTLEQIVSLDYQGNSFVEAISHLKERTQLPIIVDQVALRQIGLGEGSFFSVELRNSRGKVRHALQQFLNGFNLTYVIVEDAVLITTEETAVSRQMRQRLPIDFTDVAAGKALRDIARRAGISLVFDPRLGKAVNQTISMQVDDATAETGLRLVAELVDLKAVRMGNIVFVTDPARGERIRREEAMIVETRGTTPNVQILAPGFGGAGPVGGAGVLGGAGEGPRR